MTLSAQAEQDSAQARRIEDAESLQRAASGKANLGGLKPLSVSRAALRRAVEEADWLGQEERAEAYAVELASVERKIAKGEMWEPEW